MRLTPLFALILFAFTTSTFAQDSSRADFEEFCDLVQGRWVADIKWVADWEGVGKKGDKAVGHFDVKLDVDGHALVGRHYAGTGVGLWTVGYDAGGKRIVGMFVSPSGIYRMTYFKKDGTWMEKNSGSLVDGKRNESLSTMTFEENGNRMVLVGEGTIDGESTDRRHDVYRRVK